MSGAQVNLKTLFLWDFSHINLQLKRRGNIKPLSL